MTKNPYHFLILNKLTSVSFAASSTFLVMGGRGQKQTEVIDLADASQLCTSAFGELESERISAMGGLINEIPVLCGGYDSNNVYDTCILVGQNKNTIKMQEKRSNAASVVLNKETTGLNQGLWLMGGFSGSDGLISSELITLDPATSVNGPAVGLISSCAVKYNSSHIYLIGGNDGSDSINDVWIYNTILDTWTEGPKMNKERYDHGCTVLHHEQGSWIVVAGSYNSKASKSVEILDLNKNIWIQGENKNNIIFFYCL